MPLVRIDVNEGSSPEQLRGISERIHNAILAEYRIPERDYFHILTEHRRGKSLPRTPVWGSSAAETSS